MIDVLSSDRRNFLCFNEAIILKENYRGQNRVELLALLSHLIRNTDDYRLRESIDSLQTKIMCLSSVEFELLCKDTEEGKILFPPNYAMPFISPLPK